MSSRRVVERLVRTGDRLTGSMQRRLENSRALLTAHSAHLDALSPLRVLGRGYAVARDENGSILKREQQLPVGQEFKLRVSDGEVDARVQ